MRAWATALAIVVALSSGARIAEAARKPVDVSGDWITEAMPADTPNAEIEYARMKLRQDGATLMGILGRGTLTGSIKDGKIDLHLSTAPNNTYQFTLKGDQLIGTARVPRGELKWRAYRDTSLGLAPTTRDFAPTQFHRRFSGAVEPALRIHSGDTVRTWTVDAGGRDAANARRSEGGNPQTGPFYVEGALPGDTLAVHLVDLRLNRDTAVSRGVVAANALDPNYHAAYKEPGLPSVTWKLDRAAGVARLQEPGDKMRDYTVPLRPMLGCIGVAPPEGMVFRTNDLGRYGGNLDYNRIRAGTTVYLPVFQPGALLFVGDGHAAQGDGELTGDALETSLDIVFQVELIRGASAGIPRAEDAEYRMAMGIAGSLNEALQQATTNMARWLQDDFKLERAEVAYVLGTVLSYDIAAVVGPRYHVVARVPKESLSRIAR